MGFQCDKVVDALGPSAEAADMDEAMRIASEFPWAQTGCIEIRPVRDMGAVRRRVGALSRGSPVAGASAPTIAHHRRRG